MGSDKRPYLWVLTEGPSPHVLSLCFSDPALCSSGSTGKTFSERGLDLPQDAFS